VNFIMSCTNICMWKCSWENWYSLVWASCKARFI